MIRNSQGFTFIEMIITIAILTVVFLLIAPLFFTGINFFGDSNAMVMDQVNLRRLMTDISREVRDAYSVTLNSSTEIVVDNCTYTYNEDTKQITKYFSDTEITTVISNRVEVFEVTQTNTVIEFRVRAEGNNSTIVTKVSVRQRMEPTPEIA